MMKNINTNQELNEAIYTVLTHQYKKDCKEAHKAVEEAGYEIYKADGRYHVHNPKTERTVYLGNRTWSYKDQAYFTSVYFNPYKYPTRYSKAFDFANCLDTPLNHIYWQTLRGWNQSRKETAVCRFGNMKEKKRSIDWTTERIEEIQKQIAKLQKDLIRQVEYRAKKEAEYKEYRKQIGLK